MLKLRKPQVANKIKIDAKPILEQHIYGYSALIDSVPRIKDTGGILDYAEE